MAKRKVLKINKKQIKDLRDLAENIRSSMVTYTKEQILIILDEIEGKVAE